MKTMTDDTIIAQKELVNPAVIAIEPPMAKLARKQVPPIAAFATRNYDIVRNDLGA